MTYFDYLSQGTHNSQNFAAAQTKKREQERQRHEQRDSNQGMFSIVVALNAF